MGAERGTFVRLVGAVTAVAVRLGCVYGPKDRSSRDGGKMAYDEAGWVADQLADKLGRPVGFNSIQLQPGEAGCSTSLYTNPPR
jgi:hypothetical protein